MLMSCVALFCPFGAASASINTVALIGQVAPVTGGVCFSSLSTASVNNSGDIAFNAGLSNGSDGIFKMSHGLLSLVALSGQSISGSLGLTMGAMGDPIINDSGSVAFIAYVQGGSSQLEGLFVSSGTSITKVLDTTALIPGSNQAIALIRSLQFNNRGDLAVYAGATGDPASGILLISNGVISSAITGTALTPFSLNNLGDIAFIGTDGAIRLFSGGMTQVIAQSGQSVPNSNLILGILQNPVLNDQQEIAFLNGVSTYDGRIYSTVNTAVIKWHGGLLEVVSSVGDPVPGYPATLSAFFEWPLIDNSGRVFFISRFSTNINANVLFDFYNGKLSVLVQEGQVLTGTGQFTFIGEPESNNAGTLTFVSNWDAGGTGIFTINTLLSLGAGWISKGPVGSNINLLAIAPSAPQTLYAVMDYNGELMKSTDGGSTWWNAIGIGLPTFASYYDIAALAVDPSSPQTLYAGTKGVFKSTDGGSTWSSSSTGVLYSAFVWVLAIDPTAPQTIYAGTDEDGVFKSIDGGNTWSASNTGLPYIGFYPRVTALAISSLSPQTVYAGTQIDGIFKSTDGGNTWSAVNAGLPYSQAFVESLAIDSSTPQTIYAGLFPSELFKSTDGGGTWNAINLGLYSPNISALAIDPSATETVYAGTDNGIFKSTDGGSTWSVMGLTYYAITALAIDPSTPQTIYAGTEVISYQAAFSFGDGVCAYSDSSSLNLTVSGGGAANVKTSDGNKEVQVGYATLAVNSGATPYGTAVFSYRQNGVTVSETTVTASPPTTQARVFIDYRSAADAVPGRSDAGEVNIDTGIGMVNDGSASANVTYTLRDINGVSLSSGHGTIAGWTHFAKFIDQIKDIAPDFNLPSGFASSSGFASLEIASDQPLSIIALRMITNQRNEILFTTTPTADLTQPLTTDPLYFAHLADGGGYTTTFVLLNTSTGIETGTFQVLDDNGIPLITSIRLAVRRLLIPIYNPVGRHFPFSDRRILRKRKNRMGAVRTEFRRLNACRIRIIQLQSGQCNDNGVRHAGGHPNNPRSYLCRSIRKP